MVCVLRWWDIYLCGIGVGWWWFLLVAGWRCLLYVGGGVCLYIDWFSGCIVC